MIQRSYAAVIALIALALAAHSHAQGAAQTSEPGSQAAEIAALRAEVERLKSIVPGQAVAMTQVAYNFSNLWFAVQEQNWPLAQFYFNETRTRLRWAMRITPVRKIASGELALGPLLEALEQDQLGALGRAVENRDVRQLPAAYDAVMNGCYACHVASEKPFLRLQVPTVPAEGMIVFDDG